MEINREKILRRRIRYLLIVFILLLVCSGLTAFAVEWQLRICMAHPQLVPPFYRDWLQQVYAGVHATNEAYPFIAYGTDWLAFAHIVIAIAFIGPLRDPVRNIWVVQFGMIACALVLPLAFIAGPIRQIPLPGNCWIAVLVCLAFCLYLFATAPLRNCRGLHPFPKRCLSEI
ncbi:MAG: hypothetical protein R2794_13155 [Chitinophagales bacterium]